MHSGLIMLMCMCPINVVGEQRDIPCTREVLVLCMRDYRVRDIVKCRHLEERYVIERIDYLSLT